MFHLAFSGSSGRVGIEGGEVALAGGFALFLLGDYDR